MKIETSDGRSFYSKEENSTRLMIRRIFIYIGIMIICLIIGYFVFKQFRDMSDARMALREAKNIMMSLEMVDMEYYGLGLTIYDEKAAGSIRTGAAEKAKKLQGNVEGEIRITGYDSSSRTITGFEYELEKFIVRYSKYPFGEDSSDKDNNWKVYRIDEVLSY